MALSIKNPTTEQLARKLAAATGVSITQAVTDALEAQLERTVGARQRIDVDEVRALQALVQGLPVLDRRPVAALRDELWEDG